MEYVYLFQFNPCVFESSFKTKSIHKSKKGAYQAMRNYIEERYNEFMRVRELCGKEKEIDLDFKWTVDEDWRVISMKLNP